MQARARPWSSLQSLPWSRATGVHACPHHAGLLQRASPPDKEGPRKFFPSTTDAVIEFHNRNKMCPLAAAAAQADRCEQPRHSFGNCPVPLSCTPRTRQAVRSTAAMGDLQQNAEATLSLRSGNVVSPGNWFPMATHVNIPHHDVMRLTASHGVDLAFVSYAQATARRLPPQTLSQNTPKPLTPKAPEP